MKPALESLRFGRTFPSKPALSMTYVTLDADCTEQDLHLQRLQVDSSASAGIAPGHAGYKGEFP